MKLSEATKLLSSAGIENARREARIIFSELGGIPERDTIGCDPECNREEVISAIERRRNREPVQYILGKVDFYKESYFITKDCLIPRQDTELLVDYAVKNLPAGERFLDLCTGSGCIAISVLKNTQDTTAKAIDISPEALNIAKKNADENGVSKRIDFVIQDVLAEIQEEDFFAIISNPPYVKEEVYNTLEKEIFYEPKIAFIGEDEGLIFYKSIILLYKSRLKSGGFFAFEIGYDQGCAISKIAAANSLKCDIIKDFSGNDRVAVLKFV